MANFTIIAGDEAVGEADDLASAATLAAAAFVRSGEDVSVLDEGTQSTVARLGSAEGITLRIDELNPQELPAGGASTNMYVIGNGFQEGCTIVFAGQEERTEFVDRTRVSTLITASLFTDPDDVDVLVRNPDGAESNTVTFSFT